MIQLKKLLGIIAGVVGMVVLLMIVPMNSFAKQPQSSYWFPETLLNWSPDNDPDAVFNRSTIPLANREVLYKVNNHAQSDAKVVALSALNPNTSGVPSQGGSNFFVNSFSYWQYVDLMVYWAGSAGEGIIVPPSADVIDAAHKNGVPILGNIFFPPTAYGGKFEWVNQMLTQRSDGSFPAADKLIEVANYYGFDGWFINQETAGGNRQTADKMKEFLVYLQKHKAKNMHIMWYDAMTDTGSVSWQNALTDRNKTFLQDTEQRVADSMFLNFWWNSQQASSNKAKEIGRSPYDLYSGIDVEANGTATKVPWEGIFPENKEPWTSLGIYRPDWAFKNAGSTEEFYNKENEFWVGKNGDPAKTDENGSWKGIAHYFSEKTSINQLPFVTHFNTGSGKFFAVDGKIARNKAWDNRSLQDILPTWRWIKESKGTPLDVNFDWNSAYYGGSSLKVTGKLNKENSTNIKLYKTDLLVQKDTELSLTYKTDQKNPHVKVGISFMDDPNNYIFYEINKKSKGDWVTDKIKLHKEAGKHIAGISLFFESSEEIANYQMNIGEISIYNKHDQKQKIDPARQLKWENASFKDGIYTEGTISWEKDNKDTILYEIYRSLPNGEKEWLGSTYNNHFYLTNLKRNGKEQTTKIDVLAVDRFYNKSKSASTSFNWPPYPKPKADFHVSRTVAAPGEEIQFFNDSSEVTESVEWEIDGAKPSVSNENNPIVTYDQEGVYQVKLTAKNSEGEDVLVKEDFITISKDAKNITNVALNKTAKASGQCSSNEAARFAIDGVLTNNSKWCTLDPNKWLEIDLGQVYSLTEFDISHAEAGGEPAAFNTKAYTIEVSLDGQTWSNVVEVNDNKNAVSKHPIPITQARYIRLSIQQPTQGGDQAARIYEFEAYGF